MHWFRTLNRVVSEYMGIVASLLCMLLIGLLFPITFPRINQELNRLGFPLPSTSFIESLTLVVFFLVVGILIVVGVVALTSIADGNPNSFDNQQKQKFEEFAKILAQAFTRRDLSLEQVEIMANAENIPREEIGLALRKTLSSIYQNSDESERSVAHIESVLKDFVDSEPFEGIPKNVKIHLEHLRDHMKTDEHIILLQELSNKLRELDQINSRERRLERVKSTWSLIFGVVGGIIGFVGIGASFQWFGG
ncbi:MAG: hypothetical protein AAF629_34175 [Chloroflexota bacterium]